MLMTATTTRPGTRKAVPKPKGSVPRRRRQAPPGFVLLFAVIVVLNLIGLVMVLSASSVTALHQQGTSYYYFERQLMWLGIGSIGFVIALRANLNRLRMLSWPLLIGTLGLLFVVLLPGIGSNVNGSSRWIGVGMF